MKKIILSVLISMLFGLTARMVAQPILEYTFTSQYVGTYTPLTNPTVLFTGIFDDMTSASIDIPAIMFGGVERTSIKVNSNGWIAFGNATTAVAWYPMNNTVAGADGVIVPFGTDLMNSEAGNSSVSYQIDGATVSVQWTNLRRFGVPAAAENFSFQLIMDTANNAMFFVYDLDPLTSHGSYPQVGMKVGAAAAVDGGYVNRSVTSTNNWNTSDAGTANNISCRLTINAPATFPESGLTYSWNGDYYGCMDQAACNYDAAAEVDNGSCEYCSCNVCGCMDENACNYSSEATSDDGSCYYSVAINYEGQNVFCAGDVISLTPVLTPANGPLLYTWSTNNPEVSIVDTSASVFSAALNVTVPDFSTQIDVYLNVQDSNGCFGTQTISIWADECTWGCMDVQACNFDPLANYDDGDYCDYSCLGCTDPSACNYDAAATVDDGSCYTELVVEMGLESSTECVGTGVFITAYTDQMTFGYAWAWEPAGLLDDPSSSFVAYVVIPGAQTFQVTVTDESGCTGSGFVTITGLNCIYGCIDITACNYDENADTDDGSCDYSCLGCTNAEAVNYDPSATIDNGSCYFAGDGNVCGNPIVISCGQGVYSSMTVGVPNDNATSDAMACGGQSSGGQRWYLYESAYNSEITVSTINALTNFDTYLKVYSGTCGDLQCIAQNDDIPGTGFQSQVMFSAVEGETYLIRVGGFASMSGTFALTFDCGGGCLDEVACNYDADAPFDDGSCTYGADCFGCTDPVAENYDPIAVFDQGCQYSPLITVFHDINGDGMQQPNEPGLPNWPVYIPAISATIFSNASGAVSITLPASNFELQLVNNGDLWISSNSSTQTISLPDNMVAQFGLIPSSGETFWAAGPYDGFWDIIHCEDGYEAGVFLNNTGAVALNGTLTMTCDASFFPEADSYLTIAPDQTAPGFAQWNIAEFGAGTDGLFSFHIPGPGLDNIGVTFPFEFTLSLVDENGEEFYTESWTTTPFVACAYDPNDLTATPEGYEAPHFILPGQRIQFRVRFQNTGNFPAEDVLIIDDLDPQVFDIASFAPIYGSADYVACLHDDGTIDFIFEDIYLPDAENNEEESHGFVVFEVFARQDIVPGTVLLNQAAIFFDSNPAIITNETFHTIFDCSSFTPMMGDTELCFGESLALNATQPYVEYYEWMLDGEVVGNSAAYNTTLTELGSHELSLITGNPLCYETHETQVQINDIPVVNAGDDLTICPGESVVLSAISQDQTQWSDGIVNDIAFIPSASFVATVTATNEAQCATTDDVNIILFDLPSGNVTLANGILSASDGVAWQWYFEGALLEGATLQSIAVTEGAYYVLITSEDGCEVTSETTLVTNTIESAFNALTVYPNPMNDLSLISLPPGTFDLTLYDVTGRIVFNLNTRSGQVALERGSLPSGQYHLQISNLNSTHFTKILMR